MYVTAYYYSLIIINTQSPGVCTMSKMSTLNNKCFIQISIYLQFIDRIFWNMGVVELVHLKLILLSALGNK